MTTMIVLLAHHRDRMAPVLARQIGGLTGEDVGTLTPRDLSRPGWTLASPPDGSGRLVVGGQPVEESSVRLFVSLTDDVPAASLDWIAPAERAYVASEMTAFLRFLLETVSPRVLVPPGDCSLAGPDHPIEVWAAVARLRPRLDVGRRDLREVSVVDGVVAGHSSWTLRRAAKRMSDWSASPWLRARFSPTADELVSVTTLPDLSTRLDEAARLVASVVEGRWAA
ncbi:hypothetical protein LKO27_14940 [Tessaracoccus sp. OS52]|uniref:hypothetical protein n=1 Tax=Tessaracoccus sp. OS52 TaxID=2886691 RepID=UPI001D12BFC4|nr:hypothetical protein [Tessaracoccus sp. OS52]MCC2594697.1 hypothetical protein [Tessaracoccus sp. OS52]